MNIFITAGGTVTAQSVIKALRADSREHKVLIGDMNEFNATRSMADAFVKLPPATDANYAETCLTIVRDNRIDLLIPLIVELEFEALSARKKEFSELGCVLWTPNWDVTKTLSDKLLFARYLERIGIDAPKTWELNDGFSPSSYPVIVKPRWGSASVGTFVAHSKSDLDQATPAGCIVQELIVGREFTVDCFASAPGRVTAVVARERLQIKAGVASKSRIVRHEQIEATAEKVVGESGIVGPVNIQGILTEDNRFVVFEANTRFSGTLVLTTRAGINLASMLVNLVTGVPVEDKRGQQIAGLTMVRYWEELYFLNDSPL